MGRAGDVYRQRLGDWLDVSTKALDGLPDDAVEALALGIEAARVAVERTRHEAIEMGELRGGSRVIEGK